MGLGGGGGHRRRGARPRPGRHRLPRPDAGGRPPPPGRCTAGARRRDRRPHAPTSRAPIASVGRRSGRCRRPSTHTARRPRSCSCPDDGGTRSARSRPGRRPRPGVDLTRSVVPPRSGRGVDASTGQTRPLGDDDLARWHSLGLAVDLRRPRRRHAGGADARRATTPQHRSSTAPPSARSRRCSTCWPTRSSPWRGRAASRCTPPGRSTRCRAGRAGGGVGGQGLLRPGRARGLRDRHPGARRHRQHLGVPRPRLPAPGAALERGPRRRRRRTWTACSRRTGSEVTMDFGDSPEERGVPAPAARVARAQQPRPARRRRRRTSTGRGRRRGTSRSTTPASSACRGRRRSAATASRASTT